MLSSYCWLTESQLTILQHKEQEQQLMCHSLDSQSAQDSQTSLNLFFLLIKALCFKCAHRPLKPPLPRPRRTTGEVAPVEFTESWVLESSEIFSMLLALQLLLTTSAAPSDILDKLPSGGRDASEEEM